MRRLPLLLIVLCSCARESPRPPAAVLAPDPAPPPPVVAVKREDPNLGTYRPAVANYLERVRALPDHLRPGAGLKAYAKALDEAEEYYGRIPHTPAGEAEFGRAVRALWKATQDGQKALERSDRSATVLAGMKRNYRPGDDTREVERFARQYQGDLGRLRQSGATLRERLERVGELLGPRR